MLFRTYAPITTEERSRRCRAAATFNAVRRFAETDSPDADNYATYRFFQLSATQQEYFLNNPDAFTNWCFEKEDEWDDIMTVLSKVGTDLGPSGYCVYIVIYEAANAKVGYAKNVRQRYQNIKHHDGDIKNMYYVQIDSLQQAKAAEDAVRNFIGHGRKINHIGIGDHFQCATEDIEKFFKYNKRALYDLIKNA